MLELCYGEQPLPANSKDCMLFDHPETFKIGMEALKKQFKSDPKFCTFVETRILTTKDKACNCVSEIIAECKTIRKMVETLINEKEFENEMAERLKMKLELGWTTKEDAERGDLICKEEGLEIKHKCGKECEGFVFVKPDSKDKLI